MIEEVASHLNFAQLGLRSSQCLGTGPELIRIQWPERVLYKVNTKTKEKKILLESKVNLFRTFKKMQPMSDERVLIGLPP